MWVLIYTVFSDSAPPRVRRDSRILAEDTKQPAQPIEQAHTQPGLHTPEQTKQNTHPTQPTQSISISPGRVSIRASNPHATRRKSPQGEGNGEGSGEGSGIRVSGQKKSGEARIEAREEGKSEDNEGFTPPTLSFSLVRQTEEEQAIKAEEIQQTQPPTAPTPTPTQPESLQPEPEVHPRLRIKTGTNLTPASTNGTKTTTNMSSAAMQRGRHRRHKSVDNTAGNIDNLEEMIIPIDISEKFVMRKRKMYVC